MKKQEFVNSLTIYCEFEGGPFEIMTEFNTVGGFDSLAVLSIIAFIDEQFNKKISGEEIGKLINFNSLIELIGIDQFEND